VNAKTVKVGDTGEVVVSKIGSEPNIVKTFSKYGETHQSYTYNEVGSNDKYETISFILKGDRVIQVPMLN